MYEMHRKLAVRPDPFALMTIKDLWTRPHIARQMLAFHLDQDTSLASRPIAVIEEIVDWLDGELNLAGNRICDLGCGPGLYSKRLAKRGADVTGVDFSTTAIAYAESHISPTDFRLRYLVADYLTDELPGNFDFVTLIYYDYTSVKEEKTMSRRRIATVYSGRWMIAVCAVLLAACSDQEESMAEPKQEPDNSLMQVISGEVWYRERIALPPGAEVIVMLEDQSRADAPATVITDYTHVVDGQAPPYSFRLVFDPSAIDERMRYGLRARIEHDGKLMFTSTEHIDPFAGEPGEPVRIMVSKQ